MAEILKNNKTELKNKANSNTIINKLMFYINSWETFKFERNLPGCN